MYLKKGQHLFIPFVNGESITDSQGRPYFYKTMRNLLKFHQNIKPENILEYAPVDKEEE